MRSAPLTYRPFGDENNRISFPGRRGSGLHGPTSTTLITFTSGVAVEHSWSVIKTTLEGRARIERCDSCGITQTRIGLPYPVLSQPGCTLAGAGTERSART